MRFCVGDGHHARPKLRTQHLGMPPHSDGVCVSNLSNVRIRGTTSHLTKHIDSDQLPQLLRDSLARRPAWGLIVIVS